MVCVAESATLQIDMERPTTSTLEEYDEESPSKYIMYLDANNLHGWTMNQYLPTGNFRWMTDKEISKIDLGKYKTDGKKGLILEVDLEYPRELHDLHNDYPVAPEKAKVSKNMLSGGTAKRLPKNIRFQSAK